MKVLFIGGTGTISGSITRQISAIDTFELTLLNRGTRTGTLPENVRTIKGDINNEEEMKALALGALRVLRGESAKSYSETIL